MTDMTYTVSGGSNPDFTSRRAADEMHVESSMVSTGPGYITQSGTPTDEQFEFIRGNFGDPRANVKPTDYYAFRMIASGDGLDSYYTRQDIATSFPNFVRDLRKGQSVLGSHKADTFSYGSSFGGEVMPADESRSEYEGTFYPQWDTPDLRTKQWLVGDYYITRGVTLNNQSSDDLVRSMELGGVRKASISFMVGQYVCGIDGHDLMSTMFGPMPDEACNHFPGVAYEGQIAWALMKNNTLVETSLVYKNASPSSMLLRKAETLAVRGVLSAKDIEKLEGRFQVRLPRFEARVFPVATTTSNGATTNAIYITGTEDMSMGTGRKGGDAVVRELAREALIAEPEVEQTEAVAEVSEEAAAATSAVAETEVEAAAAVETEETAEIAETEAEAEVEAVAEVAPAAEEAEEVAAEVEAETEVEAEAEVVEEVAEAEEEVATQSEGTREEDAVTAFVDAADRLASALARNPDAFDSGSLSVAARAERAIDLALVDAGCDTTVGGHVARTFETRSRALRDALGEPLTVEAIRNLQSKATLGDTLYDELVKDAVAERTRAQGESFNAAKYRDLLLAARDVAYVKEEIESWKDAKRDRFTPGRSVVPRQVADARPTREERKSLPEAPAALTASKTATTDPSRNILDPRK